MPPEPATETETEARLFPHAEVAVGGIVGFVLALCASLIYHATGLIDYVLAIGGLVFFGSKFRPMLFDREVRARYNRTVAGVEGTVYTSTILLLVFGIVALLFWAQA